MQSSLGDRPADFAGVELSSDNDQFDSGPILTK